MLRLICSAQNYGWGRVGPKSQVAQLHNLNNGGAIDPNKPYAELWCGTHPNGPSLLATPPSALCSPGIEEVTLQAGLSEFPSWLGEKVLERWNGELPFMFKVLSIAKALSIQAHPDKRLAELLHRTRPDQYKDPNHKPEIAIAVSKFTGLCGFAPVTEVRQLLVDVPELRSAVGESTAAEYLARTEPHGGANGAMESGALSNGALPNGALPNGATMSGALPRHGSNGRMGRGEIVAVELQTNGAVGPVANEAVENGAAENGVNGEVAMRGANGVARCEGKDAAGHGDLGGGYADARHRGALKALFTALMEADAKVVARAVDALTSRLRSDQARGRMLTAKESLSLVLHDQHPHDVGVLASFFLNLLVLEPGEAMYMGPNVPHAYIEGECVECMATSDNVVRAGLTPKPRDTATLCEMLTYDQDPPHTLQGEPLDVFTRRYSTPFEEFEVDCVRIPPGINPSPAVSIAHGGPSVILVYAGEGSSCVEVFDSDSSTKETALLTTGHVYFLPATCKLVVQNTSAAKELVLYRAGCSSLVL